VMMLNVTPPISTVSSIGCAECILSTSYEGNQQAPFIMHVLKGETDYE